MKSVVKLSGNTIDTPADLTNIAHQIGQLEGDLMLMVSGPPDARRRINAAINNEKVDPVELFSEFDTLYYFLGQPSTLRGYRDAMYLTAERVLSSKPEERDPTSLVMYCDGSAALVLAQALQNSGIESRCLGFSDKDFPILVKGDPHNASISKIKPIDYNGVVVFPSTGGRDETKGRFSIKLFDRGGGDVAASRVAKELRADELLFVTDTGVKEAPYEGARVVNELDLDEAYAGAHFNVGVSNPRAIELWMHDNHLPQIYMTGARDLQERTKVVKETGDQRPVKFVAARNVEAFRLTEINGEIGGAIELLQKLSKAGVVPFYKGTSGSITFYVPDSSSETAQRIIRGLEKPVRQEPDGNGPISYVGVVGAGMKGTEGVAESYDEVFTSNRINIIESYEPNQKSMGKIIGRKAEPAATQTTYRKFLQPA